MSNTNVRGQFGWTYKVLCREKCLKPLSVVLACSSENHLRFCIDRVEVDDWSPILNAIARSNSLCEITMYSRSHRKKIRERINTEQKLEQLRRQRRKNCRQPVLFTNFLLRCLVDSIAVCLRDSRTITILALNGIPLAPKYLNILSTGMLDHKNLTSLSLAKSRIGDTGCDLLLGVLMNHSCLQVLNLSSCHLTSRSGMFLSLFIKRRKANLLQNVWNESDARMETVRRNNQGLHTLVLNKNRKLGDAGIRLIMEVLRDDFWLKSLSLRHCGISQRGAHMVIELLRTNSVLMNIDLKGNEITLGILRDVTKILKRRQAKGELLPMRKRLFWRNVSRNVKATGKNFHYKQKRLKLGQCGSNLARLQEIYAAKFVDRKRKRKKKASGLRKKLQLKRTKVSKDHHSDEIAFASLKLKLLNLSDCNDELAHRLKSSERLIEREKHRRLRVERRCRDMEPQLETMKSKIALQRCICSRASGENKVFKNLHDALDTSGDTPLRKESRSDISEIRGVQLVSITETKASLCTVMDGFCENKVTDRLQKRPHCPNRSRKSKNYKD